MDLLAPQSPMSQEKPRGTHPAWAIFGWLAFGVLLFLVLMFSYKVWVYYGQIRRGDVVDLPQFPGRLTRLANATAGDAPKTAARDEVEKPDNPELGVTTAALTIVEFADFQCPYSKDSAQVVRRLATKYGERVRFIYRDYPLTTIHPYAEALAEAAECSREQGRFWQFHDKVFLNGETPDSTIVLRYGDEIGLDGNQFSRCIAEHRYKANVQEDLAQAQSLNLAGTPTFFFNGQRVDGSIPEDAFDKLIQRFIGK